MLLQIFEQGGWKPETGSRKQKTRDWKQEAGNLILILIAGG